ncbi:hypothetical protein OESDEN_14206 [Oesophagostomum dentatum]|uniref:Uncharacterized protein n=1 Tax=Oesophagostomum dentatum TaxID=61180 RepID=A0A0B1SS73_OESDE|nr:hypothetical protein OESDEN_14206 [Oesophagostomum dentatum]
MRLHMYNLDVPHNLNESPPSERTGTDPVYAVKMRHARRLWPLAAIQSVTESRTATDATEHCLDPAATDTAESNHIHFIMDRQERFKKHDILVDRIKVPNRHVVSYTFSSTK